MPVLRGIQILQVEIRLGAAMAQMSLCDANDSFTIRGRKRDGENWSPNVWK
jgi:hypothetical protein